MNIKERILILMVIIPISLIGQESICPDVEGYVEHSVLKKYKSSCVIGFNEVKYEKAILPLAQQINGKETDKLIVEGKITDILFAIENEGKSTVLEVQRNYESALRKSEMNILYSCSGRDNCFKYGGNFISQNRSFGDVKYIEQWEHQKLKYFRFAMSNHNTNLNSDDAYFLAQGRKNNKKFTIALLIRYNRTSWQGLKGNIFVFAKVIEEDIMDMDQVSIETIDEKIKKEGKKVFTNIHFEFGSSKLSDESLPIIKVLSEYLKENPSKSYYIVGHTDNIGSLSTNQELSENRAAAVRDELINQHSISTEQITSHGVGQLSPVVANTSEEGRALNRRVEVVVN